MNRTAVPTDYTTVTSDSTEQSPSSEANRSSASQEISHILSNLKVHYRVHERPSLVPILIHIDTNYALPTALRSFSILSSHLRLGLPSGLFQSVFPTRTLYPLSPHPYVLHASPISLFFNWPSELHLVRSTYKVPRYVVFSTPKLPRTY